MEKGKIWGPETNTVRDVKQKERDRIKEALLLHHAQMVEFGKPEHVISQKEAQQILGFKNQEEVKNTFRALYGSQSLGSLLEALGLPTSNKGRPKY